MQIKERKQNILATIRHFIIPANLKPTNLKPTKGAFKYDLTPGGESKILEKCEDYYIKIHKKCEEGGWK